MSHGSRTATDRVHFNGNTLTGEIWGDPTACLDRAREIGRMFLQSLGSWHFSSLEFNLPRTSTLFGQSPEADNFHIWHLEFYAVLDSLDLSQQEQEA